MNAFRLLLVWRKRYVDVCGMRTGFRYIGQTFGVGRADREKGL